MPTSANNLNIASIGLVKFDGTSAFTATTTTNHNILLGGSTTNSINNLAPPTTDKILRSAGASSDPAWTTNFKVNSSGNMTNTSQPCFFAHKSSTSVNVTGDGTAYKVACNTVDWDQGSNYNNSTYTFTAPVAGTYLFFGYLHSQNISASFTSVLLEVVTTSYTATLLNLNIGAIRPGGATTNQNFSGTCVVKMAANDTAFLQWTVSGSTKTMYAYGDLLISYPCSFGGFLIC